MIYIQCLQHVFESDELTNFRIRFPYKYCFHDVYELIMDASQNFLCCGQFDNMS